MRVVLVATVLVLAGCPLSRSNPYDPVLCNPRCQSPQICYQGACVGPRDGSSADGPYRDSASADAARSDLPRGDAAGKDIVKIDGAKIDAAKIDAAKIDAVKTDAPRPDASKPDTLVHPDGPKPDLGPCPPVVAPATGWEWLHPLPQGNDLNKVWIDPSSSTVRKAYAVGNRGTILHYDGCTWYRQASGTTADLHGVWGNTAADVFAVGRNATILRFANNAWAPVVPTGITLAGTDLRDVWRTGTHVFVVGDGGTIAWSPDSGSTWPLGGGTGKGYGYGGVRGRHAADVHAVGTNNIQKFNGTDWTVTANIPAPSLFTSVASIAGPGSTLIAVGASGTFSRQDNGGSWNHVSVPTQDYSDAWGTAGQAIVAGQTGLYVFNGTNLTSIWSGAPVRSVAGYPLAGFGSLDLFAVGQGGAIRRLVGAPSSAITAQPMFSRQTSTTIEGLWMASASEAFAVGQKGLILHLKNGQWIDESIAGGPVTLKAVWGSGPTDVYAVGGGTYKPGVSSIIYHYNGAGWTPASPLPFADGAVVQLNGVWGSSASDVFVVGGAGKIVHWNGVQWSAMTVVGVPNLRAVWGTPMNVHAVGNGAVHWTGGVWQVEPLAAGTFNAIHGTSPTNIFAVGDNVAATFDGAVWKTLASPASSCSGVWVSGSKVYVSQPKGVATYDAAAQKWAWPALAQEAPFNCTSMAGYGGTDLLVGGENGAIARFVP